MLYVWVLSATVLVSLISLAGILTFGIKAKTFDRVLVLLVGFAAGVLIGNSFLHLLPSALEILKPEVVFLYVLFGFTGFFFLERYLYWRHCHTGVCEKGGVTGFTYLNLIGDGVHNFIDGFVISASFITDFKLGVVTTAAIILHEVPQEIGDFVILIYGGFSRKKALFCNFICAITSILGAVIGLLLSNIIEDISPYLVSIIAGGFIYISASDLIPEVHRQKEIKKGNIAFVTFVLGLVFMALARFIE